MEWTWSTTISLVTIIASMALYFIARYFVKKYERYKKSPPGPWGLPVIGSLLTLNRENAILKIQEYKKTYGKIFSMNVGNFRVAVINDYKLIHEAFKREEFLGRPDFESYVLRNGGFKNRGVLFSDGTQNWHEQRRFALRTLRDFGFGKRTMDGLLLQEVEELVQYFKKEYIGKPVDLKHSFNRSVFNSVWYIISDRRFERTDPVFMKMISLFTGHLDKVTLFNAGHYYLWPAKYNLIRRGLWKQAKIMHDTAKSFTKTVIKDHLDNYDENVSKDFIDVYLHAHNKSPSTGSGFYGEEGLENLNILLLDLIGAGTETTSTTLLWALLFMTKYPEVQKKLHEEIDLVLGKDRQPSRDDRLMMPYLEAFTNEVHRKSSIIPMSVYHKVLKDCDFGGYFFEKNTIVYANIYDAHHDKEFWGDPEVFRPERFLDSTGTKVVPKKALMPFSTGKRICLGETMARDSLFYFLCGLLQSFTFELDPSSASVDIDTPKPNFVKAPHNFKIIMSSR
ncbi:cytochrome P450 2J6-like [Bradysia coprophila]|uniref:cytochrome P450 2J6-like n=1 Tax=Bradysia coprophila TaxID=38358 RepID=UPI00187D91E3|nr:cytochrome P450 2J6-like [Bradysia coprophila]